VRPFNQPRQRPEQIEIQFTFKNNIYRLRSNRSNVTLFDADNHQLGEVFARQRDGGSIEHLQLVAEGLLWINGDRMDYLVRLDLNQSPIRFGALEAITLTPRPSSRIGEFILPPDYYSHGQYSQVLNRLFITGHRRTLFGTSDPVATEWVNGQPRPLPKELYDTELDKELPQLNGVLFIRRKIPGDPLKACKAVFYDGVKAMPLLQSYMDEDMERGSWSVREIPFEKRVFLHSQRNKKTFMFELKAGPKLNFVLSQDEPDTYTFFGLPEDSRLFAVGDRSILTEMSDRWRTVISIIPPSKIISRQSLKSTPGLGEFVFTISNPETKVSTDYFLVRSSTNAHCFATPDPDNPIKLKAE